MSRVPSNGRVRRVLPFLEANGVSGLRPSGAQDARVREGLRLPLIGW